VFTCASAILFTVGKRTREVLDRVLGETFDHWLMSDGYWAYRRHYGANAHCYISVTYALRYGSRQV